MERLTTAATRSLIRSAYAEVMSELAHAPKISKQEIYAMIADRIGLGHSESTIQKYVAEYLKERRPQ